MKFSGNILFSFLMATATKAASLRGGKSSSRTLSISSAGNLDFDAEIDRVGRVRLGNPNLPVYVEAGSVSFGLVSLQVEQANPIEGEPMNLDRVEYSNSSPNAQTFTLKNERSIETQYTSSVTAGFKTTIEIKSSIGVKGVFGSETNMAMEVSASATDSFSEKETVKVAWDFPMICAANHRCVASVFEVSTYAEPAFTADVEVNGLHTGWGPNGEICYTNSNNRDCSVTMNLFDGLGSTYGSIPGFRVGRDRGQALYQISGKFGGVSGRSIYVDMQAYPLVEGTTTSNVMPDIPAATTRYYLNADGTEIVFSETVFN